MPLRSVGVCPHTCTACVTKKYQRNLWKNTTGHRKHVTSKIEHAGCPQTCPGHKYLGLRPTKDAVNHREATPADWAGISLEMLQEMINDEYKVPSEVLETAREEQERRAQNTVSHASHLQPELPHCADGIMFWHPSRRVLPETRRKRLSLSPSRHLYHANNVLLSSCCDLDGELADE